MTTPGAIEFAGSELWNGVPDAPDGFVGFYGYYDGFQFDWQSYYGGDGATPPIAVAIDNAANAPGWTLLLHGTDDGLIEVGQSRNLAAALEAAGRPVRLIEEAGAAHGYDMTGFGTLTSLGRRAATQVVAALNGGIG